MSINEIIIYIMVFFAVLGALDKIIGNKFGLGEKFEEGIMAIGALAISMVGIIALAPVIATLLKPIVVPIFGFLGADPAMFAGSLIANDMGGAPLAQALAIDPNAGLFGGLIVGAMLGPTIVFTIPVALGIIEEQDRKYLATGVLAGVITIPIGSFVGGLVAGFPFMMVIRNLVPIIIFAILIALGLWKFEDAMIKGFTYFGKFVVAVITIGLAAGIVEQLTGIVLIPGMNPIREGFEIVADIAIVLSGAFPLVYVITKVFKTPLMKLGKVMGMNDVAAAGLVASLANSIPMFGMMKDMDNRGKILNVAFAVSAAFVFGDHLGFTAGFNPAMIFPMIVGKLVGGITAIFVAMFIANKTLGKE
ncbi:ethanolamine utilization protein EutH [Niameybacter massiliensis]|uniref:Ethanolamine utilization protein EutH n=1 Tax=Holtiella tumoricola TaxID=3018743 RepID=A0AA42DQM4_9FIRM|nr:MULTISPECIES: ethanolamine utilization protein EutH [Lachnospirales]MDA3733063.1 ethanolamine utilization protein EutH [Holtiella tumoricola]